MSVRRAMAASALLCGALGLLPARALAVQAPARPVLKRSFNANVWSQSIASGEGWTNKTGPVRVNATMQAMTQVERLKDGRTTNLIFQYGDVPTAGVYSLQPFFEYRVCFTYPLPGVKTHTPIETFDTALGVLWCPNGQNSNDGCLEVYNKTTLSGEIVVGGTSCQHWAYKNHTPPDTIQDVDFCVTEDGRLLSVNLSFVGLQKLNNDTFHTSVNTHNVFTDVVIDKPDVAAFELPSKCVDLRPITGSNMTDTHDTLLNDPDRLAKINREADGWTAGPQTVLEEVSLGEFNKFKLGLEMAALKLPLPTHEHRKARGDFSSDPIPVSFDAREKWGAACPSIAYIRNQGRCGSCFAFAATEAFTDRMCIAAVDKTPFHNLTLSPEYLIDCDSNDHGCSGGFLDNAWEFLVSTGLPTDSCDPYEHCQGNVPGCNGPPPPPPPATCASKNDTDYGNHSLMTVGIDSPAQCCEKCAETLNCVLGVYEPPGLCHLKAEEDIAGGPLPRPGFVAGNVLPPPPPYKPHCRSVCKDGSKLSLYKAKSAYAVGAPGDVVAMQRELLTHGPFEVGFEVFSDFGSYTNGTYARTKSATGPGGGHAVKLVGWGVDAQGVDYWTIANSWSAVWGGLNGFFRMRRGTNECGIEETSAAGLPLITLGSD